MKNIASFKDLIHLLKENDSASDYQKDVRRMFDEAWSKMEADRKKRSMELQEIRRREEEQDRLQRAAWIGRVEQYEKLKSEGVDPNQLSSRGEHALYTAVERGNVNFVRAMLQDGVDPDLNEYRKGSGTPLHIASGLGKKEIMKLLLLAGADPNARISSNQVTPLKMAFIGSAGNTDKEVIKILLNAGADPFNHFADPKQVLNFFDGDISWWDNTPEVFKAIKRTKGLFKR